MFTRLHLTNFKAWRDTGDISLGPVTMLLGTNSSGKSSLIQSLLLLKQTVMSPDRTIHLNLGGDDVHDYFNFGDFIDVLTQDHASAREFKISLSFESAGPSRVPNGRFEASYGQSSTGGIVIRELLLSMGDQKKFRAFRREKGAYSLFIDDEAQPRGKGRYLAPERSIAFPAEAIALFERDGPRAEDLSLALRNELGITSGTNPRPVRSVATVTARSMCCWQVRKREAMSIAGSSRASRSGSPAWAWPRNWKCGKSAGRAMRS